MDRSSWSGSESPGEDMDRLSDSGGDKTMDGDPEGVWSPDIEQSFQEALAIYPPCGRRKIILSDEGKMYGRNELIARYIKLRTGKTRTRKQFGFCDQNAKEKALQSISSMSSAQIVSATAIHSKLLPGIVRASFPGNAQLLDTLDLFLLLFIQDAEQNFFLYNSVSSRFLSKPTLCRQQGPLQSQYNKHLFVHISQSNPSYSDPLLECVDIRQIYDKFPEKKGGLKELFGKGPHNAFYLIKFWADLNHNMQDDPAAFYGVTSQYESSENMTITCSTKVCSFGKQVVEKVETEYARFENGRFVYRISRSPMCEYMINFIHKLKHLPEKYMMNSVLENFTILLVCVYI
ncbi:hypothetical protein PAMP_019311 [Pampus punctatissimus]